MTKYSDLVHNDPHYERECKKYAQPIPSREFIMQCLEDIGQPTSYSSLIEIFKLKTDEERENMRRRLIAMVRDGQLMCNRKGAYVLAKELNLVRGRVGIRRDGSGFVMPEDGRRDVFLPYNEVRLLLPEDRVLVRVGSFGRTNRRFGKVVEILERGIKRVVGCYKEKDGAGFVYPVNKQLDDHEIIVPTDKKNKAKSGQLVVVEIISYPTRFSRSVGEVIEVLGEQMAPGMETEVAIRTYELPHRWSAEIEREVSKIEHTIDKEEIHRRKDLRDLPFVTIDGEDAKDFDDAVYCEKTAKNGWILYVAIADVGFYVKEESALDKEALARGNSVYFPNHVIPMLPEVLSCGICSLKPKVDRLVLVCEMRVSEAGKINSYSFYEGIICSHARLTYDQAHNMLEGKDKNLPDLLPYLHNLRDIYHAFLKQRKMRGALDFTRMETKIIFNKKRKVQKIVPLFRHYVHSIIEECMLAANVCASNFLLQHKISALYRIHEGPNPDKLQNVRIFLRNLGLHLGGGSKPTTQDYAKVIGEVAGRRDEHLVQTILLRSLSQAVYAVENIGHFGLGYKTYAHFTSPIRRYPDLLNHRAIRHLLQERAAAEFHYDNYKMQNFAEHCSMTERRADAATRDVMDWLKCEYMLDKLGEVFSGIISSVTDFGLFVELKDVYVDGLLHITSLPEDYYEFDAAKIYIARKT